MSDREWKSEPPLFHTTLPETRWSYAPMPIKHFERKGPRWSKIEEKVDVPAS